MRVTVTFADDVAAELQRLRRERSITLSEAVNQLVRTGVARKRESANPIPATHDERDAEILARTGADPELAGLAEHTAEAIRARGGSRSLSKREWQGFHAEYGPHMLPPDDEG